MNRMSSEIQRGPNWLQFTSIQKWPLKLISACFLMLFCLACNSVPENWHICVNKGLNYLLTWTTHLCIPHLVCDARGTGSGVHSHIAQYQLATCSTHKLMWKEDISLNLLLKNINHAGRCAIHGESPRLQRRNYGLERHRGTFHESRSLTSRRWRFELSRGRTPSPSRFPHQLIRLSETKWAVGSRSQIHTIIRPKNMKEEATLKN